MTMLMLLRFIDFRAQRRRVNCNKQAQKLICMTMFMLMLLRFIDFRAQRHGVNCNKEAQKLICMTMCY